MVAEVGPGGGIHHERVGGLLTGVGPERFAHDARGSIAGTLATGGIPEFRQFDPWGAVRSGAALGTGPGNAGQHHDADSGLSYAEQRWYDPGIGRFLSEDPYPGELLRPITLQPFIYASANPMRFIDPTGLISDESLGADCNRRPGGCWGAIGDELERDRLRCEQGDEHACTVYRIGAGSFGLLAAGVAVAVVPKLIVPMTLRQVGTAASLGVGADLLGQLLRKTDAYIDDRPVPEFDYGSMARSGAWAIGIGSVAGKIPMSVAGPLLVGAGWMATDHAITEWQAGNELSAFATGGSGLVSFGGGAYALGRSPFGRDLIAHVGRVATGPARGMAVLPGGKGPGVGAGIPAVGAGTRAIGFADDAVSTAYRGMRSGGGHAMRHLIDEGLVPNAGSLASRAQVFEQLTSPMLRSAAMTFDWRLAKRPRELLLGRLVAAMSWCSWRRRVPIRGGSCRRSSPIELRSRTGGFDEYHRQCAVVGGLRSHDVHVHGLGPRQRRCA